MDYADISYFNYVIFAENNHDRNQIDLDLQKHLLLFAYRICTFLLLAWHITFFIVKGKTVISRKLLLFSNALYTW